MRPLNIANVSTKSNTRTDIQARLQKLRANDGAMEDLVKAFNNGNIEVLNELLASTEEIILKVMLTMPESRLSVDCRVSHAMAALREFALTHFSDLSRPKFQRFFVFYVRQALLALELSEVGR
jgi:hypothetical protein